MGVLMATYQFVIELIPRAWVDDEKNKIESLYYNDFYDLSVAWKNYKLTENIEVLISQILPKGESWNKDIQMWGKEEFSDIQLRVEDGNIDSIKIRLDLRVAVEDLKMKIIDLAKQLDCCLLIPSSMVVLKPKIDALNKAILNSSTARFIDDPEKFLSSK